jgi:hypothetical protein
VNDRKLYIIGNGFDLWHNMPTEYENFKEFVREHDSDIFRAIEDYLQPADDWSDLESSLAEINVESVIGDLEHFMTPYGADDWSDSGHHNFQYEVGRIVNRLSKGLRHRFGQWIRQLPIPTPETAMMRLRTIDSTARFLTFNYTSTLQELYSVPDTNVLHIHGRANLPDSDLVLGHAWNPQERQSLNDRPDIEEIDTRLMEAHSIVDEYFSNTFKPSARLIQEHRPFFEQLIGLEEICVLGHSLSIVDILYFRKLLAMPGAASARWQVACRCEREVQAQSTRLLELGVEARSIVTCPWSEV